MIFLTAHGYSPIASGDVNLLANLMAGVAVVLGLTALAVIGFAFYEGWRDGGIR